jgi:hypothetical protein
VLCEGPECNESNVNLMSGYFSALTCKCQYLANIYVEDEPTNLREIAIIIKVGAVGILMFCLVKNPSQRLKMNTKKIIS